MCRARKNSIAQFQEKIFAQFTRLTHVALATRPAPQLIVWPESSTPAPALLDAENNRFVMELSASSKTDLLLGTIDAGPGGRLQRGVARLERAAKRFRFIANCIWCRLENTSRAETRFR